MWWKSILYIYYYYFILFVFKLFIELFTIYIQYAYISKEIKHKPFESVTFKRI